MHTNAAILYQSFYGTTKQYAISISEKLCCDIYNIHTMDTNHLSLYDTFIVCSSTMRDKLKILPFLKKHKDKFLNKRIVLVVTYMNDTPPLLDVNTLLNRQIPIFYKEGRLTKAVSFLHLLHIFINTNYYSKHRELAMKLHCPKHKPLQSVHDIVDYCIHELNIKVPVPLQLHK